METVRRVALIRPVHIYKFVQPPHLRTPHAELAAFPGVVCNQIVHKLPNTFVCHPCGAGPSRSLPLSVPGLWTNAFSNCALLAWHSAVVCAQVYVWCSAEYTKKKTEKEAEQKQNERHTQPVRNMFFHTIFGNLIR